MYIKISLLLLLPGVSLSQPAKLPYQSQSTSRFLGDGAGLGPLNRGFSSGGFGSRGAVKISSGGGGLSVDGPGVGYASVVTGGIPTSISGFSSVGSGGGFSSSGFPSKDESRITPSRGGFYNEAFSSGIGSRGQSGGGFSGSGFSNVGQTIATSSGDGFSGAGSRFKGGSASDYPASIRDDRVDIGDGSYSFAYETEDGVKRQEQGSPTGPGGAVVKQGSWSFVYPDGTPGEFKFVADENGYRVQSDLLPTPHPLPAHAVAQIEKAEREKAAGITHDGSYKEEYSSGGSLGGGLSSFSSGGRGPTTFRGSAFPVENSNSGFNPGGSSVSSFPGSSSTVGVSSSFGRPSGSGFGISGDSFSIGATKTSSYGVGGIRGGGGVRGGGSSSFPVGDRGSTSSSHGSDRGVSIQSSSFDPQRTFSYTPQRTSSFNPQRTQERVQTPKVTYHF